MILFKPSYSADTDSFILAASAPSLDDCVRATLEEEWRGFDDDSCGGGGGGRSSLLEDPESLREQSGKFKIEGVWSAAYLRSCKAYYLYNTTVTDDQTRSNETIRMRSVQRRALDLATSRRAPPPAAPPAAAGLATAAAAAAADEDAPPTSSLDTLFGQDAARNAPSIRILQMKPTVGFEVVMINQSRSVPHCINLKRIMPVTTTTMMIPPPPLHRIY